MEKCVDSLLKAGDEAEILIVNDGSKDRTGEIAAAYAAQYPDIVRVLTQENGGHGEGINHGLREAAGTYFKVVDSDDWLDQDALAKTLEHLRRLHAQGDVDLFLANYVYEYQGAKSNRVIHYRNCLPEQKVFSWEETKWFRPWQYITLHSSIYRTQILKDLNFELPKHTFYEDNLFVYLPLPYTSRLYYLDVGLYHYCIGREDQSVSEQNMKSKCSHQIRISKEIFKAYHVADYKEKNPRLAKYLDHEVVLMLVLATAFTRMNRTDEAEKMMDDMWKELYRHDPKYARRVKNRSFATLVSLPGKPGREIGLLGYRIAHRFIAFN